MPLKINLKQQRDDTSLKELFGSNIRQIRKLRGWSQTELSVRANVSLDLVGRIERGKVGASFKTIANIASALNVHEHLLFENNLSITTRGARSRLLGGINVSLSKMSDDELYKAKKLLEALIS